MFIDSALFAPSDQKMELPYAELNALKNIVVKECG